MPKTTTENATLPVTMRLTPRLLGRLDEAAEREGVGRVEWIRAAIVAALRAARVK
jgi:metal-responsive CopG/Arc/MetJ family transcriptional regulator